MKIVHVVQHLSKKQLEVVVQVEKDYRKVNYQWYAKDGDVAPDNWWDTVQGELSQDSVNQQTFGPLLLGVKR